MTEAEHIANGDKPIPVPVYPVKIAQGFHWDKDSDSWLIGGAVHSKGHVWITAEEYSKIEAGL